MTERTRTSGNDHVHIQRWVKSKPGASSTSARKPRKHVDKAPPLEPGYNDLRNAIGAIKKVGTRRHVAQYAFKARKGTSYTESFPRNATGQIFIDVSHHLVIRVAIEAKDFSHGPATLHEMKFVYKFGHSRKGFPVLRRIVRSFDGTAFYFKSFHGRVTTKFLNPVFAKRPRCK